MRETEENLFITYHLKYAEMLQVLTLIMCLFAQYLDSGIKRRSVLLLEAGSDVQHVHLASRHHYPHQGVVISSSTLKHRNKSHLDEALKSPHWAVNVLWNEHLLRAQLDKNLLQKPYIFITLPWLAFKFVTESELWFSNKIFWKDWSHVFSSWTGWIAYSPSLC